MNISEEARETCTKACELASLWTLNPLKIYMSPGRPGVTFWEEYTALSFERGSWKVLGTYHIWVLSVLSTVYVQGFSLQSLDHKFDSHSCPVLVKD